MRVDLAHNFRSPGPLDCGFAGLTGGSHTNICGIPAASNTSTATYHASISIHKIIISLGDPIHKSIFEIFRSFPNNVRSDKTSATARATRRVVIEGHWPGLQ